MVKNLQVYSDELSISKRAVHSLISFLKSEFNLSISSLSISFISSSELKRLNKKYLKHNYETDIITFNYSRLKNTLDGEILISVNDAFNNAKKYKVTYSKELSLLVIHGLLHLLGFDDKEKKSKIKMRLMENNLINRYNFTLFAGK